MVVTYRQLRIAKSCSKILFCVLMFGSYWILKQGTNNDRFGADVDKRTDVENGRRWMDPANGLSAEKVEVYPDSFMVRHLLESNGNNTENCTRRGISSFKTVFTNEQRLKGAIIINFLVSFYMCGIIGYCCAAYFVPSLEIICQDLNLSPDVAGATFMAAGSSAPEFFSAFIGTFLSEDDTGISAIVGSAAFNVFIIISFCCFLAGQDVKLTWWPLFRDCVIYVLSVIMLVFFMYNNVVEWWEGLILSIGYIFYIILMYFNPRISAKAIAWKNHHAEESDTSSLISEDNKKPDSYGTSKHYQESGFSESYGGPQPNGTIERSTEESGRARERSYTRDASAIPHPFQPPDNTFLRASWIIGLPTIVLMFISIPDCRLPRWRRFYMVTFFCSVVWLMGTSYILYWMITVIGYTLDIPDTVMGISLLAGGTSVPDLIASVLVVRHGYGDMAISNIIGSNIFEVFVCLGFLWFIKSLFFTNVIISSEGLTFTSVVLLLTVAFIVIAIHINGWKLNRGLGVICMGVYFVFITFAILRELGIIGGTELPIYCPGPE